MPPLETRAGPGLGQPLPAPGTAGASGGFLGAPERFPLRTRSGRRGLRAGHAGSCALRPGRARALCTKRGGGNTATGPELVITRGEGRGGGGYLPVALVVYGDEIHEEHVVSHGVHAEYLHLEGGEHAPATERRKLSSGPREAPRGRPGVQEPRGAPGPSPQTAPRAPRVPLAFGVGAAVSPGGISRNKPAPVASNTLKSSGAKENHHLHFTTGGHNNFLPLFHHVFK